MNIGEIKDLNNNGFSFIENADGEKIIILTIIGEIEGHDILPQNVKATSYEHILPILASIEASDTCLGLLIILHTNGGDVDAGLALAEMLSSMKTPKVSLTLGASHSIGIPIALAADYTFITKTGIMLAHPIRLSGTTIGCSQSFEYLEKLQNRITDFVCSHSKITKMSFEGLIYNQKELTQDVGTMLVGQSCISSGLIDEIGGISESLSKLKALISRGITDKSQNELLHP
jgi:ATP-dependent protease ClpP protease subunit